MYINYFFRVFAVLCENENTNASIVAISPEQICDIGDSVELNCTVDNPDNNSVIWIKKDRDRPNEIVILSMDTSLSMRNSRFGISSNDSKSYLLKVLRLNDGENKKQTKFHLKNYR